MDERESAYKATEFLVTSAADIARAKAELVKCEAMLRVVKSLAMRHSGE